MFVVHGGQSKRALLMLALLLFALAPAARADDADTLTIGGIVYRLDGIDAPELDQNCLDEMVEVYPCGQLAVEALRNFIAGRTIHCDDLGPDPQYPKRRIGRCRVGDIEIICCQDYTQAVPNSYNSVMYVRNVHSGAWDKLDCRASCLAIFDGALIAGDPISNNIYVLFSGYDDDESPIENYWQDGQLNLGTDNLKVAHHMRVQGLIQPDQDIEVYTVLDDGTAVLAFTIEGTGSYVDQGLNTPIGSYTIGSKAIGGGSASVSCLPRTPPQRTQRRRQASAGAPFPIVCHQRQLHRAPSLR